MANEKIINARLQQKHDIAENWLKATNFFPKAGEIIVYDDLNKIKIGDGTTNVDKLPFVNGSVGEKYINESGEVRGEIFNDYENNQAAGEYSHAEGYQTTADNTASHAEGMYTYATGEASHAEGVYAHATGAYSHAEGTYTYATTTNAHAEGENTYAKGYCSHAEGTHTNAEGEAAHAEGGGAAARGDYAHAEGYNTEAIGQASHASGLGTIAQGDNQTVVGQYNAEDFSALFIVGNGDENARSNAFIVNNDGSATLAKVGENDNNVATVGYVKANAGGGGSGVGEKYINESGETKGEIFNDYANNTAGGEYSHAEGLNTGAIGEASHAEGYKTSTGFKGYSEVYYSDFNNDPDNAQLVIGSTEPAKYYSIGDNLQIGLVDGSILKDKFKISDIYEVDFGSDAPGGTGIALSKLTDENITIETADIKYIGVYNKPYGDIVIAEGAHAHSEGYNTLAIGENAHAEGKDTVASGDYSHAGGLGTIASKQAQTAIGQYNAEDTDALFVIGNGDTDNARNNAFTVKKNGDVNISGNLQAEGADFNNTVAFHDDVTMDNALEIRSFATVDEVIDGYDGKSIVNVEYLNAQLNALITVADIDAICGSNIVAASEVTF